MTRLRLATMKMMGALALCVACQAAGDEPGDPEDGMFTGPKADGFCVEPGSPEEAGVLALVNDEATTFEELDRPLSEGGAGLNATAARNIIEQRPFANLEELDAVPFVGPATCNALRIYACEEQGRCEAAACDPETFRSRPPRTDYDSNCEAALLALLQTIPSDAERVTVDDAAGRCDTLSPRQIEAFEYVASEFGEPPAEFSEIFGEFSVQVFPADPEGGIQLVHVIEEQDFLPFHLVFEMDTLVAVWTTDGLSAGVDWYCGGDGEDRSAPEEFCVGALTDDAAWCDPGDAEVETSSMKVGEAREDFRSLAAAAVSAYADDHTLGDDVSVAVEAAVCDDVAAVVSVSSAGLPAETFRVVDSTRGLGRTVLTRTTDEATEIVCLTPNG